MHLSWKQNNLRLLIEDEYEYDMCCIAISSSPCTYNTLNKMPCYISGSDTCYDNDCYQELFFPRSKCNPARLLMLYQIKMFHWICHE